MSNLTRYKVIFAEGEKYGVSIFPAETEQEAIEKAKIEFPGSKIISVTKERFWGKNVTTCEGKR